MQSETGFPSSHQLKSYVASKSHLKLAALAVLSADAGLLVVFHVLCTVGLMISYVTAVDCILHRSDKNVKLTTSVVGALARPSQYLCNMITFKNRE